MRYLSVLVVVTLGTAGCNRSSDRESVAVQRWLLCEECVEGERDSVIVLQDRAVSTLGRALNGPPKDRLENIRRQVEASYERIASHVVSRDDYVRHFLDNYVATYQARAAIALGQIRTPRARALLLDALRHESLYRIDVRRALGTGLGVTLDTIRGGGQSAPVGSFLLTNPSVVVRDTAGQPVDRIRVVFTVDSGGGSAVDSIQFTGPDGIASVRWRLGPIDSINVLRVVAAGRMVRFHAIGVTAGLHFVFTVQPTNVTVGQPIAPPVEVTVQGPSGHTATSFVGSAQVQVGGTGVRQSQNFVAGVASFPNLRFPSSGTGFRLTVGGMGLARVNSNSFDVLSGPANHLVFSVPPTTSIEGTRILPAVQVTALDTQDNTLSGFNGNVTLTITAGTGGPAATLLGTTTVAATAGVAVFSDLRINVHGNGYKLSATASGLSGATSAPFNITFIH